MQLLGHGLLPPSQIPMESHSGEYLVQEMHMHKLVEKLQRRENNVANMKGTLEGLV